MISVVIFDLDETLAATGHLPPGRRTPSQLLSPGLGGREWVTDQSLADLPGELICRGYSVAIATRAPRPYASTLIHLLGVDTRMLWASCGQGLAKATQILQELELGGITPPECIYVGDGDHDREIATHVGCQYVHISDAISGAFLASLPPLAEIPRYRRPPNWANGEFEHFAGLFSAHEMEEAWAEQIVEQFDHEERVAFACASLRVAPQKMSRRENQLTLFANLTPEHASCIVQESPFLHVDSRIVTKAELRRDAVLRRAYLEGLSRCFPGLRVQMDVGGIEAEVRSVVDYQSEWGRALGTIKNYGNHDRNGNFRSGPEPELGGLDFVADVVAAQILDLSDHFVVPTPSHPYSDGQPGEVSRRLAHLVAERVELPVAEVLERQGADYLPDPTVPWSAFGHTNEFGETDRVRRRVGPGKRAVLIEDQITTGNSINNAVQALSRLPDERLHRPVVVSYSMSRRVVERCHGVLPQTTLHCGLRIMTQLFGVNCLCGRNE